MYTFAKHSEDRKKKTQQQDVSNNVAATRRTLQTKERACHSEIRLLNFCSSAFSCTNSKRRCIDMRECILNSSDRMLMKCRMAKHASTISIPWTTVMKAMMARLSVTKLSSVIRAPAKTEGKMMPKRGRRENTSWHQGTPKTPARIGVGKSGPPQAISTLATYVPRSLRISWTARTQSRWIPSTCCTLADSPRHFPKIRCWTATALTFSMHAIDSASKMECRPPFSLLEKAKPQHT
mmetsp:Transcript_30736/g.56179  ORF Transcript_30736/g.56179 Transcript_30736/m.56179 type:complete len:236 (+) Transcript_30736:141-848(+)